MQLTRPIMLSPPTKRTRDCLPGSFKLDALRSLAFSGSAESLYLIIVTRLGKILYHLAPPFMQAPATGHMLDFPAQNDVPEAFRLSRRPLPGEVQYAITSSVTHSRIQSALHTNTVC